MKNTFVQLTNNMRRIVITFWAVCAGNLLYAQTDTVVKKSAVPATIKTRASDHFMLQLGAATWQGKPDSIRTKGLSRTFNAYFMFAFPFKTNPQWSVALGAGIATDNIYFDRMNVGIKDATTAIVFSNLKDTVHFKKYKLATAYLEAPVELRFTSNPTDDAHSVKIAIGAKVGTLLSAATKGKTLEDKNGTAINAYIEKEKSKRFFNTNRLSVMARLGYGHFSLFTSYSITPLFKDGVGPGVRPLSIGLTLSGL